MDSTFLSELKKIVVIESLEVSCEAETADALASAVVEILFGRG